MVAADIMNRHNARMIEIGNHAGFGQIRFGIFGLRNQPRMGHFHRNTTIELFVVDQIHQSKPTFTEHLFDPITTDPRGMFRGYTALWRDWISVRIQRYIIGI